MNHKKELLWSLWVLPYRNVPQLLQAPVVGGLRIGAGRATIGGLNNLITRIGFSGLSYYSYNNDPSPPNKKQTNNSIGKS